MSNEIVFEHDTSAVSLYAVISNAAGQRWNTAAAAFQAHADGSWTDYDIALTEQGTSRKYQGNFPTGIITAGMYLVTIYLRAGGSPAITDTKLGAGSIDWSGSAEVLIAFAAGVTLPEAIRRIGAATSGVITDAGEDIENFQDWSGAACIAVTVDADGNRTSVAFV